MATFNLKAEQSTKFALSSEEGIGAAILYRNVRWFVSIRNLIISLFLLAAIIDQQAATFLKSYGIVTNVFWPVGIAIFLCVANLLFMVLVNRLKEDSPKRAIRANIWLQIITDLIALTAMVHFVGSTETFIAFAYLFHIVLACIFLSTSGSLIVLLLALVLYMACVGAEISGLLPPSSLFVDPRYLTEPTGVMRVLLATSVGFIWLITWYLVSTLSRAIRERDSQLDEVNLELLQATQAKTQWMLRTAHDLKAPFSGIETNIALLKFSHWNDLPDPVKVLIEKIESRATGLRQRIGEILLLGEIRSNTVPEEKPQNIDIKDLLNAGIDEITERAKERKVILEADLQSVAVLTRKWQLSALLANVISNAVNYSLENGVVQVSSKALSDIVLVRVSDQGIGISSEELPKIFDEYYRGKKAREIKSDSTGLGLAIAKEIARKNGIAIKVESEKGKGTCFEILIPMHGPESVATLKVSVENEGVGIVPRV